MFEIFSKINNICKKLTFGFFSNYKIYYDETHLKYFVVYKNKTVIRKNIPSLTEIISVENPEKLKIKSFMDYHLSYSWLKSDFKNLKDEVIYECYINTMDKAKEICENHKELKQHYKKPKLKFISYE
jgi:hypothetical protein